jgi:hypothetical protein
MNQRVAFPHRPRCDRIQQLQQQIETWQALLEKLAGNESVSALIRQKVIASSNYSSRLKRGKRLLEKLAGNESAIASSNAIASVITTAD